MRDLGSAKNRRIVEVCRARLARLPVAGHSALRFDPWVEGYRNYVFGARAGPTVSVTSLFHELAHAAQFGAEKFRYRATDHGFQFKVPRRFIFDRYCDEPRTGQATHRELQTFAYQLHLLRLAGHKVADEHYIPYCARLMQFMHDWYFIPGKSDEARARYCAQVIEREFHRVSAMEVSDRLEGWLDATTRRMRRTKTPLQSLGGYLVQA